MSDKYGHLFTYSGDFAICNSCNHRVAKKGGNTKSIRIHLEAAHADVWKQIKDAETNAAEKHKADKAAMSATMKSFVTAKQVPSGKSPSAQSSSQNEAASSQPCSSNNSQPSTAKIYGNWSPDGPSTKKAHRALAQLVASANLPISIVGHPAFINFCSALQPFYRPPGRDAMTDNHVPALCEEYEEKVRNDLEQSKHISLTSDIGSTKNQKHSLLSMTAHFIRPDGNIAHCYAAVIPLCVRYTGLAVASVLDDCIIHYGIREKVHMLIRDNGSNMISATDIAGIDSEGCFAHIMQNAIKDGLNARLVDQRRRDSKPHEEGHSQAAKVQRRALKVQSIPGGSRAEAAVDTRWNSLHTMLKLFVSNRPAIESLISSNDDDEYPAFEEHEWTLMKQVVEVLEPLKLATDSVQSHNAHIGVVLPVYFKLLKLLRGGTKQLAKCKIAISTGLKSRMVEWRYKENMLLATVLDPRFKISCFESASVADEVKDLLKERAYEAAIEWVRENAQDAMSSNESEPDEPSSSIMQLLLMDNSTSSPVKKKQRSGLPGSVDARQKANVEVETYLSSKLVTKDKFSPYKYWEEHRVEFPVLRSLAQCYLTAPSTSAESERMFSTRTVIYNHLRQSMTGATFQKLLFLSRNIPIYGF